MSLMLLLSLGIEPVQAQDDDYDVDAYDHIMIVLDGSGSMNNKMPTGETRIAAAKVALHSIVNTLDDDTRVGLIAFGSVKTSKGILYPLGPRDEAKLNAAIDGVSPGGGTPLGKFIKRGADSLLEARAKSHNYGTYKLLVVTDGEASDANLMMRYAPEVVDRGITLDVIGVSMDKSHTLKSMAHSYRSADDTEQLVKAVKEVFAEIDATQSDDLQHEVFEVLEGLPDAFALAAIESLAVEGFGNQPIGAKPKPKPKPSPAGTAPGVPTPPPSQSKPASEGCAVVSGGLSVWMVLLPLLWRRRQ